ncbi:MAG: hypothetical protein Q9195_005477 [Heterodermia aff. obscurata]
MSTAEPTPSPIPKRPSSPKPASTKPQDPLQDANQVHDTTRPHPKPRYPTPKLRLRIEDLSHPGSSIFLTNSQASTALSSAVETVLSTLYLPTRSNAHIPGTRSVTVILEPLGGVAYTTGTQLDDDHKEIHFSLDYINQIAEERRREEIQGVLVHEMVHCWQWNARGTCPGGLIEGIADYVRLKAGLDPPHWKRPTRKGEDDGDAGAYRWDAGYEKTGFFLEWLEGEHGEGSVRSINASLRDGVYEEKRFWVALFGEDVEGLWKRYFDTWEKEDDTT